MRFQQRVTGAIAFGLAAAFLVPMIGAENVTEKPVSGDVPKAQPIPAEPIPTAESVADDGKIPAPKPGPALKTVPKAEPIPAEPVPVAEPVSDVEEGSDAVPAAEMITAPGTIPAAEPVPVAEAVPDSKMVPVAEPVVDGEKVPAANPTTVTEAVSVGNLEPSVNMPPIAESGGSLESLLVNDLDSDAETNTYTEEILALGPPWIAPEEDTMTLREMFLRSHREQLEIYDLNHDNQISEEEWQAANEDDLARGEKFFVVDKNEDGEIDENEAVGFLMERVSLSSTYIDATTEDGADITRGDIKDHAPSELRVTLFSIPLGD